jgi:hypothetical protein
MVEQITTAFIILGGLVGIALGTYGLAPAFFHHRLANLRLRRRDAGADDDWPEDIALEFEDEDGARLDQAYGVLVDSRRREKGLFGLPSAWQEAPAPAREAFDSSPPIPSLPALPDTTFDAREFLEAPAFAEAPQLATAIAENAPPAEAAAAEAWDASEMLDIFREALPDSRTREGRLRSIAIETADVRDVSMKDLLADARWTVRALLKTPREVRAR